MIEFHVKTSIKGKIQGPFTGEQLEKLAESEQLQPVHLISSDGGVSWRPAKKFSDLKFAELVVEPNGADTEDEQEPNVGPTFTKEIAEQFLRGEGCGGLNRFTAIDAAAAESLSKNADDFCLYLNGLTTLSDAAAESLSKYERSLSLDGLTSLSDAAAESLSKHQGNLLSLISLTDLSDEAAKSLADYEGILDLPGNRSLPESAAKYLRKHMSWNKKHKPIRIMLDSACLVSVPTIYFLWGWQLAVVALLTGTIVAFIIQPIVGVPRRARVGAFDFAGGVALWWGVIAGGWWLISWSGVVESVWPNNPPVATKSESGDPYVKMTEWIESQDPEDPAIIQLRKGRDFADRKDFQTAIACFSEAIRLKPEDEEIRQRAYMSRAMTFISQRKPDLAVKDSTEIIRLSNDEFFLARAYVLRAKAFALQRKPDLAIRDSTEAIRLDPVGEMYLHRSKVYLDNREFDKAIKDATEAIRLKPDAIFYFFRGFLFGVKGEHGLAIKDYSEGIRLKPDEAQAYNDRGVAYGKKGEYDEAIKDFSEVIRLKPDDASAYTNRGIAYKKQGDQARADADFAKAKELNARK